MVTPIPFTHNGNTIISFAENTLLGIDSFTSSLRSNHVVYVGGTQDGIVFFDLLENKQLSYFNVIATAEGVNLFLHSPLVYCICDR